MQRAPETTPYPADAVAWLAGDPATGGARTVVAVGRPAPDPELLAALAGLGHDVRASDGSFTLPDDSVDVVLGVHGPPGDLDEVARVLRPGGRVAFMVPGRDTRIPWARKLDRALGVDAPRGTDAFDEQAGPVITHGGFGFVEEHEVRFWQQVDRRSLLALAARLPEVARLEEEQRAARLEAAGALYDDYGRGVDGMQLPWLARCYRATVRTERAAARAEPSADPSDAPGTDGRPPGPGATGGAAPPATDGTDPDGLLIDFR